MTVIEGVDSATRIDAALLRNAGKAFAIRYVSRYTWKVVTGPEATDLHQHGISLCLVFEDSAQRMLLGYEAGRLDAQFAEAQIRACGVPDIPIFFAADWDVQPAELHACITYLQGAAGVLGSGRIGAYGGIRLIRAAQASGYAAYLWQTAGWSGGQKADGIHLYQTGTTATFNGIVADRCEAYADDYGQWRPSGTDGATAPPFPGRYVTLTDPRMHGDDVRAWQAQMVRRGWNLGTTGPNHDGVDGDWGPLCDQVLHAFQVEKDLHVDSPHAILGPESWYAAWTAPVTS